MSKTDAARRRQLKNAAPMIGVLDEGTWPVGATVTLETLMKHYERYGWDRTRKRTARGYSYIDNTYQTYHQMRSDSLVEVARVYLDRDDYLQLVAELGRPEFVEEAIDEEGWNETHGEQSGTDVRTRGYGSEPTGTIGNGGYDGTNATEVRGRREAPGGARIKGQVPNPFETVVRG